MGDRSGVEGSHYVGVGEDVRLLCWRCPLVVVRPCLDGVVKGREIKGSAFAGVASRPFLHAAAMRASSAATISMLRKQYKGQKVIRTSLGSSVAPQPIADPHMIGHLVDAIKVFMLSCWAATKALLHRASTAEAWY